MQVVMKWVEPHASQILPPSLLQGEVPHIRQIRDSGLQCHHGNDARE